MPIGSMYAIYGNIYHQYTPNVSIYTVHGSYGYPSYTLVKLLYEDSWLTMGHHRVTTKISTSFDQRVFNDFNRCQMGASENRVSILL